MVQNPVFALAFSGESFTHPRLKECQIERRQIGELVLTSGQIVACDPAFIEFEVNPFSHTVNPGRYPITVCIVRYADSRKQPDQRIACATLHLMPSTPSTWELATFRGQPGKPVSIKTTAEYSVDSAIGCFMDADAARQLADSTNEDANSTFNETLAEAMDANYVHTRSWGDITVASTTGLNVIAFSSGWGDGAYTSYWGLDTAGQAMCILTDFQVLSE